MKRVVLFILSICLVFGADLPFSQQKSELLRLKRQKVAEDIELQKNSWISPLILSASINKNRSSLDRQSETKNAGIGWSQDLFRSGGIYYTIEQAKASGHANMLDVDIQETSYLKEIYTLKSQVDRDNLKFQQNELTLNNRDIDLFIIKAKYKVGSADISELNRATLDRDRARTDLIVIKNLLRNEKFGLKKLIEDAPLETLSLIDVPLISKEEYIRNHLEFLRYKAQDESDDAQWKRTRASYLPKLTFNGSLGYREYSGDFGDSSGEDYLYGVVLSMPLDINTKAAVESDRLKLMQTRTAQSDRRLELEEEYAMRFSTVSDYEEKISMADEMLLMYMDLYSFTDKQVKSGFKSEFELESLGNSVEIQKLEKELQNYNIMIEKIALYFDTKQ